MACCLLEPYYKYPDSYLKRFFDERYFCKIKPEVEIAFHMRRWGVPMTGRYLTSTYRN